MKTIIVQSHQANKGFDKSKCIPQREQSDFSSFLWIPVILLIERSEARHNRDWRELTNSVEIEQLPTQPHAFQRNITAIFFSGERWLKLSRDFQGINNGSRPFYDNRREKQTQPRASGPGSRRHQSERASRAPNEPPSHINFIAIS